MVIDMVDEKDAALQSAEFYEEHVPCWGDHTSETRNS